MRTIGIFLFTVLLALDLMAQKPRSFPKESVWSEVPVSEAYTRKLQLIDSIRQFIISDLKLSIGNSFYTDFASGGDSMYVFLYVSRNDTIAIPAGIRSTLWRIDSEDSAIAKSNSCKQQGYQTLVYKTAGLSNAQLNRKLLSYPEEAIAYILFHEATHRHVGMEIEYEYIEALCDAMANLAIVRFAEKTGLLDLEKVNRQKMIFENAYALLNEKRRDADRATVTARKKICSSCNKKMKALIRPGNQFVKDRMGYTVNNAYFIRVEAYAKHYFELKERLGESLDIDKTMTALPTVKPKTETKEIKLQKELNTSPFSPWDSK